MIKAIETSGKTVAEATAAAVRELGVAEDDVSVEVLTLPKAGFFGIGAVPARVRVSFDDGRPEPRPARAPKPERTDRDAPPARERKSATRVTAPPLTELAPGSREERTHDFLQGLLKRMGVECSIQISPREGGGLDVKLDGPNMGAVIGRRGETLDAIQHLTNYAVNRGSDKHAHINVDAENYRSKREDSLVNLAHKMAAKAIKYKRSMALEPMNSYERHVIHSALQDYEGVSTSSTGTEPNRRVVVNYERAPGESPEEPRRHRAPREERSAAPRPERAAAPKVRETAPAREQLPPDYPEGYEPPAKNKPESREWC